MKIIINYPKLIMLAFILIFGLNAMSQKHSISINSGFIYAEKMSEARYFSANIALRVIKSLYISPSFTYIKLGTNLKGFSIHGDIYNSDLSVYDKIDFVGFEVNRRIYTAFDLNLKFKPLELLDSKYNKHELVFGTGYGVKYGEEIWSVSPEGSVDIVRMSFNAYRRILPTFMLFEYNYKLSEKWKCGIAYQRFNGALNDSFLWGVYNLWGLNFSYNL